MKKSLLLAAIAALLTVTTWAQRYSFRGVAYYINEDDGCVSSGRMDLDGGRDGYAWFKLTYQVGNEGDTIEFETGVMSQTYYEFADPDGKRGSQASLRFKDGSVYKPKEDVFCDYMGTDRGNSCIFVIYFDAGSAGKQFTTLRSKDLAGVGFGSREQFPLDGLAASSADVIDNLCHVMEWAGLIPEGILGKSPHHHWAIDKELNCTDPKYRIGDRITIDGHEGIIFELSERGTHGKAISVEAAPEDLEFCTGQHKAFGNYSFTNGAVNCNAIMAIRGWKKSFPALAWCKSLGTNWYLPSCTELDYGLKRLAEAGILSEDEAWGNFNHCTYGHFSPLDGDIDFVDIDDNSQGLVYSPLPTYAVAAF